MLTPAPETNGRTTRETLWADGVRNWTVMILAPSQHVTLFGMRSLQLRKQIVIILVGPKPNDKCPCGDEAERQTQKEGVGKPS